MTYSKHRLQKIARYAKYGKYGNKIPNMKDKEPNGFEKRIYQLLKDEGIEFEREYQIPGTSKFYDVYIPLYNTLLELDGDYWHPLTLDEAKTLLQKRNFKNDIFKNRLALKHGYKLIRIRQSQKIMNVKELLNEY